MTTDKLAKPESKAAQLKDYLTRPEVRASIQAMLPKHMTADRLVRIALQAGQRNPRLLECTQGSLLLSLVSAAQLGLEAGGLLGSAYLVPYRNKHTGNYEAQLIPGYRGLIDLARRSGEVLKIEARVVRRGEDFSLDYGEDKIRHIVALEGPAPGDGETAPPAGANDDILGVYAVATLKSGVRQVEFMHRWDVDRIRKSSRAADDGPWVTDFAEMARKTVVRRLAKYLPLSADFARAMEMEDNAESGGAVRDVFPEPPDALDPPPAEIPAPTKAETIKAKMKNGGRRVEPRPATPAQLGAISTGFKTLGIEGEGIEKELAPYFAVSTNELSEADAAKLLHSLSERIPPDPDGLDACIEPEQGELR